MINKDKSLFPKTPIELRSDEVQVLMGKRIPGVLLYGTAILLVVITSILVAGAFVTYPSYINVDAKLVGGKSVVLVETPCGTILKTDSMGKRTVERGDTLAMILTPEGDTTAVTTPVEGLSYPTDFYTEGMHMNGTECKDSSATPSVMFVIENRGESDADSTRFLVFYVSRETASILARDDSVLVDIDGLKMDGKIEMVAEYPKMDGLYAVCWSSDSLPHIKFPAMNYGTFTVRLRTESHTIFNIIFKDKLKFNL